MGAVAGIATQRTRDAHGHNGKGGPSPDLCPAAIGA